jgi:hypothetical protein
MNGEDSFEAVQYIPVLKTDFIMKSTLDKELCNTLIELAGQKLETGIVDNLEGVRRTGWHLQRVSAKVEHCISTRLNYPHFNKRKPASMKRNGMQFVVAMYNAWISFYDNNSFVHPHCHEEAPNFYSIAAYLSTGDSDTSLSFMTDESPSHGINRPRVVCKQGDLVIFPSNLYHYTNDTSDGRIVLSGNYYAGYMPNINMGEG